MNKRVLRKFAIPSSSPNPKNGIFCADQVKYVVRTAIKNIDHQRTLVLYIYAKESVLAGNHRRITQGHQRLYAQRDPAALYLL